MSFKVQDWINAGCNYQDGLVLLKELIASSALYELCSKFQNTFTETKMREALEGLLPLEGNSDKLKVRQIIWSELPVVFNKHRHALKACFVEQNMLRSKLIKNKSRAKRAVLAAEILQLDKGKMRIYKEIDLFLEKGILPETPKAKEIGVEERAVAYMRALVNNPPYISKYKADPGKKQEIERRITELATAKEIVRTGVFI